MAVCCRRCYVSGRVQGVGFRFSTRRRAQALGVAVSARNLSDGRVEVIARGSAHAVDVLCEWLRTGPAHACVVDVSCEDLPPGRWPDVDEE